MPYRTKTYIAGDWTGDSAAIQQLYRWNEGDKWSLHFVDAHSYSQCYDSSMPCTIKSSLRERMNRSKTFVLVVGNKTASTRKGACLYYNCSNARRSMVYDGFTCMVWGKAYSTQSFIDYECELAYKAYLKGEMKIVVLYNSTIVRKSRCPAILRNVGKHVAMKSFNYFSIWDYATVRKVIED